MNVLFYSLGYFSDGGSISDTQPATVSVKVVVVVGKLVIMKLPCLRLVIFSVQQRILSG